MHVIRSAAIVALMAACSTDGSTGSTGAATLTTNGGSAATVSAWSTDVGRTEFLGINGAMPQGYVPWTVYLGSVPEGTTCGTGDTSLYDDASSWLATVAFAVPYAPEDDTRPEVALAMGSYPVIQFSSELAIMQDSSEIQVFEPLGSNVDLLSGGTVTITSFDANGITGNFDATGSDGTTSASASFTASRCDFK